jgi:asparagine synthase (glutamine-hydrolysing)
MCGIAAVVDDDADIDAIVDCLRHRGPDHRGVERFGRVSLGMVRLAILDPQPRSNQPFTVGSHSIVFNGEIYNFREARAALAATGVEFTSESDTEVLLRGLIAEGPSFLSSLEGMYAFVLLDHTTGALLIGRDPEGIKPLYHRSTPTGHVFASEARAAAIGAPTISIEALREYLAFGSTWSRPIQSAVSEFPPGHVAELEPSGELRFSAISDRPGCGTDDVVDSFDGIVERHLRSDRPVALALSGGFDSALLASRISRIAPDTTAITLDTGSNATDVEGAIRTATHYGLTHEIHRVDPSDVPDAFERFIDAMDQPTVDGFNTFLLSEFTRLSGIPVLLSGLGADEALDGYSYARHDLRQKVMRHSYRVLPPFARRRVSDRIADRFERSPTSVDRILSPESDAVAQYFAWREVFSPNEITTLTASDSGLRIRSTLVGDRSKRSAIRSETRRRANGGDAATAVDTPGTRRQRDVQATRPLDLPPVHTPSRHRHLLDGLWRRDARAVRDRRVPLHLRIAPHPFEARSRHDVRRPLPRGSRPEPQDRILAPAGLLD